MRRFCSVLVLVFVSLECALGQADSTALKKNQAEKLFAEGTSLQKAGKYSRAIEKYKAALGLVDEFSYHYQLGLCYKSSKQLKLAIDALLASLKLKPNFAGSHSTLGEIYLVQKDYDRGIESFKLALKFDPQLKPALSGISAAYERKGQALLHAGELSAAGALMDEALQQSLGSASTYLLAARVYNQLDRPLKSIEAATVAMKLRKEQSKGAEHFEIGIAYKKMMEYDQARKSFSEARKDPKYSRPAQNEINALKGK